MTGSSPHPWGTLDQEAVPVALPRFIPTPLGNTRRRSPSPGPRTVHPHTRGEHGRAGAAFEQSVGSSPHPWGTRPELLLEVGRDRFIPTPVGNTVQCCSECRSMPVHPHARGEHADAGVQLDVDVGSSPRPWGTLVDSSEHPSPGRFIPTPVGNTLSVSELPWLDQVHPHARGEHHVPRGQRQPTLGSSPRPWGTLEAVRLDEDRHRFIPTPVGNTSGRRGTWCRRTVHPHARGEHPALFFAMSSCSGSSPRPWGTPSTTATRRSAWRFIPTPVGNTFAS